MTGDGRILNALLRADFRAFTHKVFLSLTPGQTFIPSWHLDAIAHRLERVRLGKCKRLIINMPPRSLKSIMSSVAFPAFILGHDPKRRIICVSYSAELAKKHSNDFRAVLESNWYRHAFPGTRVGVFKNNETEIELTARGFRLSTSVGGTLTGRGGDIIVIDDPLKPDDAYSETIRNRANEWFKNTLLSRLDEKKTGAIVIVMQRVHMDDLTGFLTEQSDEWEILNLPAIAEHDETIEGWDGEEHFRKAGEALSPEREPIEILNALKQQIGSDAFSSQYQQMPVPPGGAMVKRAYVQRYDELPPTTGKRFILQSWDTANKGGPDNDWSVCTTWAVSTGRYYLLDVWRRRVDYPQLKAHVVELAKKWGARRILVEDAASGSSLVQELRGRLPGITAIRPKGDKKARMAAASAMFESGRSFLPRHAPWMADLESELYSFPGGRHDDQCDSISQALIEANLGPFCGLSQERWDAILEAARNSKRLRPRIRY